MSQILNSYRGKLLLIGKKSDREVRICPKIISIVWQEYQFTTSWKGFVWSHLGRTSKKLCFYFRTGRKYAVIWTILSYPSVYTQSHIFQWNSPRCPSHLCSANVSTCGIIYLKGMMEGDNGLSVHHQGISHPTSSCLLVSAVFPCLFFQAACTLKY